MQVGADMNKTAWIEVVQGPGKPSLYVSDADGSGHRLAGPKPWGGGQTIHRFEINIEEAIRELEALRDREEEEDE